MEQREEQHGFHFDGSRCTGCKTCMLACKDYYDLPSDVAFRQVYECEGGSWCTDERGQWTHDSYAYYVSVSCNHCAKPVCIEVCPTGAMHKDAHGLVSVDERRCIGCGYCALSCPYRAPKVDRSVGHSVKCDGCASRMAEGRLPVCVEACPLRALDFGPIAELRERHGGVADLPPLPDVSATGPHLVITPPACVQKRHGLVDGGVANADEIV